MLPSFWEKVGVAAIVITELVILTVGPIAIGRYILLPIDRAIRATQRRLRFELADFIWLLVQIQVVLAIVVNYVPRSEPAWLMILLTFLVPATIALWYGSTQAMLRAGVKEKGRRALFVLLILPSVLIVMMGLTIFYLACPVALANVYSDHRFTRQWLDVEDLGFAVLLFVSVTLFGPFVCWMLRRIIDWILANSALRENVSAYQERANS